MKKQTFDPYHSDKQRRQRERVEETIDWKNARSNCTHPFSDPRKHALCVAKMSASRRTASGKAPITLPKFNLKPMEDE